MSVVVFVGPREFDWQSIAGKTIGVYRWVLGVSCA